jgi:aspartate/methionine/tyrosine aminotransferase
MQPLQDIAGPPGLTNPYGDVALLRSHRDQGHDLSGVIYLSLGETWKGPPSGLLAALRDVPAHAHGYQLTPHGVPALREVLRDYITRTHHLAEVSVLGSDFEVAGTAGSTRSAMRDFGRLLLEDQPTASARPIAVCGSPGWDYPGVYTPLGYEMRHFALDVDRGYQPDTAEVKECLSQARQDTTGPVLLIVNAQHNPSGSNWSADVVREMVRAALEFDVHVLVDDAYYAVHDPAVTPTSALRILLEEIASLPSGVRRPRWLATRSMGKQFNCNGWGVGAAVAAPETLEDLYARLLPQHTYTTAVPLQAAMAAWLADPAADAFLAEQRAAYAVTRAEVAERIQRDLHYPADSFFAGDCGPYMLVPVPPSYAVSGVSGATSSDGDFRRHCLQRAGVLLGEGYMSTPGRPVQTSQDVIRLYLGLGPEVLATALERIANAGLGWHGPRLTARTHATAPAAAAASSTAS